MGRRNRLHGGELVFAGDRPCWERQDWEPLEAYSRFTAYLRMGSGRTLRAAFDTHARLEAQGLTEEMGVPPDDLPPAAPVAKTALKAVIGTWRNEYQAYMWEDRALSYDIDWRMRGCRDLVDSSQRALIMAVRKIVKAMVDDKIKPVNFREALDGIIAITDRIDPEAIKVLRDHGGHAGDSTEILDGDQERTLLEQPGRIHEASPQGEADPRPVDDQFDGGQPSP